MPFSFFPLSLLSPLNSELLQLHLPSSYEHELPENEFIWFVKGCTISYHYQSEKTMSQIFWVKRNWPFQWNRARSWHISLVLFPLRTIGRGIQDNIEERVDDGIRSSSYWKYSMWLIVGHFQNLGNHWLHHSIQIGRMSILSIDIHSQCSFTNDVKSAESH